MKWFSKIRQKLRKFGFNTYGSSRVGKVKQMIHTPFVLSKKHYCPICGEKLNIEWITQQIYEDTPEAKDKNLLFGFNHNPVEYAFAVFSCEKCGNKLSINDQFYRDNPKKLHKYQQKYGDYKLKDDYYTYLKNKK